MECDSCKAFLNKCRWYLNESLKYFPVPNKNGESINDDTANSVSPYVKGMKEPVFLSNNKTVLAYDAAGTSALLFNDAGIVQTYNFPGNILNGKMSDSGQFVFVTEDVGAKAAVKTYSASGD